MKNHQSQLPSKKAAARRQRIQSVKAQIDAKRTFTEKAADFLTDSFGTVTFLFVNVLFFAVWIVWNRGLIPGVPIIDPYPFGFLTMVVSLEAICLAIVVLISQNRQAHIAELREETDLYITSYAENEITKVIYLLTFLLEKHGIDISKDAELKEMLQELESERIEKTLEKQLNKE
jgi:uncharacterized membrane protein